jgi:hypothetical protein
MEMYLFGNLLGTTKTAVASLGSLIIFATVYLARLGKTSE